MSPGIARVAERVRGDRRDADRERDGGDAADPRGEAACDENSGASRNSGAMRASTSVKASTCCSENRSSRASGVHPPAISSGIEP